MPRHVVCSLIVLAAMTTANVASIPDVDSSQVGQVVIAAWNNRRSNIESFEYVLKVVDVYANRDKVDDPFDTAAQAASRNGDVTLELSAKLCMSGPRIAWQFEGEQWDDATDSPQPRKLQATFDGKRNKCLASSWARQADLAFIEENGQAHDRLIRNDNQIAIWLAHTPKDLLRRMGCQLNEMRVVNEFNRSNGRTFVELVVPSGAKGWTIRIRTDSHRGHLPVWFAIQHDGKTRREYSIEYAQDDDGLPVSGWKYKQFTAEGTLSRSSEGYVARSSLNKSLDKRIFDLMFPVGAHVVEKTGEGLRHFLVLADGQWKPIPEGELDSRSANR